MDSEEIVSSCAKWWFDFGAFGRMTYDRKCFTNERLITPFSVRLENGNTVEAIAQGTFELKLCVHGKQGPHILNNVFLVPAIQYSLISVSTLVRNGITVPSNRKGVHLLMNNTICAVGTKKGLFLTLNIMEPSMAGSAWTCAANLETYHEGLGYAYHQGILNKSSKQTVDGLKNNVHFSPTSCATWTAAKQIRSDIHWASQSRSYSTLCVTYSDVFGPLQLNAKFCAKYLVTFIDNAIRWTNFSTISNNSRFFSSFVNSFKYAQRKTSRRLKCLQSGGGGEYVSKKIRYFYSGYGARYRQTCANTPH